MGRTVQKILEDDKDKLDVGTEGTEGTEAIEVSNNEGIQTPSAEETIAAMKKELEAANARAEREAEARKDAETRASAASTTAGSAVQSQIVAQEQAIESKISTAKTSLDSIKQQLKQAKAAGDNDAEVELSDALTDARYQLNAATWEKTQFEKWKEAQAKTPPAQETKAPYTAKERAWIDDHPEFYSNKKFSRTAKLAAQEALEEGHKQDSAAYFKYIEDSLKEANLLTAENEPLSDANTTVSVAAAPNRSGNGAAQIVNKNSKYPYIPNGFRIPADWVEAAKDQGFDDPREYANMRLELEKESKVP